MLIGIDASRANRDHKSGTEWYSYYSIRWLAKLDNKNQYILYTDKPLRGGLLDLTTDQYIANLNQREENKFDKDGYQIIKSRYNNFRAKILTWPFDFFWTLGRLSFEMLIHRPDVLFVPAHSLPLFFPKKTITTIHDIAFEKDKSLYQVDNIGPEQRLLRKILGFLIKIFTGGEYGSNSRDYLKWSTRFALKHAKRIITVSRSSRDEILKTYKAEAEKIKVIYNGYNKLLYRKINDSRKIEKILDKYGLEKPFILYVGRLEKKKNTPLLIDAFAILREANKDIKQKLVLIGDASFGYDEVIYVINEFNLDSEVIMPGWVEEEDVPYIYNAATAFIFPSKHEGFGIPIIQAMACGVPVIASNIPVLKEIAEEAAMFFNPNDENDMAKVMTEIVNNKKLREKLIIKGGKKVKEFSWEKCAQATLKEINSL